MLADSFVHPIKYQGTYPSNWAGFYFMQRLNYGTWLSVPGWHLGIDYNNGVNDLGDPVYAVANGKVISSKKSSTYGYSIVVEHMLSESLSKNLKTKVIRTLYGHVQNSKVRAGQVVKKGKQICELGKAGTKYPHLHLEMYKPHNYSAVKSVRPSYPADNKQNLIDNYFDGFRIIEKYNKLQGGDMEKVKQWYRKWLRREGEASGVAWHSKNTGTELEFANGALKELHDTIDGYRKRESDLQMALSVAKNKPAKTVIKEVVKIVDRPVEVIKEIPVDEKAVVEGVFRRFWNNLFKK